MDPEKIKNISVTVAVLSALICLMLSENDKFQNIVTDRGMEAMPNLENYLARRYIREGRFEDAQVFIESLESKYANSFIISRGPNRRIKWIPATQAAENLRMLIE